MKRTFLPDVNIWVALAFDHHDHHALAAQWADRSADASLAFCRLTQQGLLRLATNARVMGEHVRTMADAWRLYDDIMADSRVSFAPEPVGLEVEWRGLTNSHRPSTHLWNDAYLAAFAVVGGYELVTLDRGFAQFKLPRCTILA